MKRFMLTLLVAAVAILLIAQTQTIAKTATEATKQLNKAADGEIYLAETPKVFKDAETEAKDQARAPRFRKGFYFIINALQRRVETVWRWVVLPAEERQVAKQFYLFQIED